MVTVFETHLTPRYDWTQRVGHRHAAVNGLWKISPESEVRVEKLLQQFHTVTLCLFGPLVRYGLSRKERSCWSRSLGCSPKAVTTRGVFSPLGLSLLIYKMGKEPPLS